MRFIDSMSSRQLEDVATFHRFAVQVARNQSIPNGLEALTLLRAWMLIEVGDAAAALQVIGPLELRKSTQATTLLHVAQVEALLIQRERLRVVRKYKRLLEREHLPVDVSKLLTRIAPRIEWLRYTSRRPLAIQN